MCAAFICAGWSYCIPNRVPLVPLLDSIRHTMGPPQRTWRQHTCRQHTWRRHIWRRHTQWDPPSMQWDKTPNRPQFKSHFSQILIWSNTYATFVDFVLRTWLTTNLESNQEDLSKMTPTTIRQVNRPFKEEKCEQTFATDSIFRLEQQWRAFRSQSLILLALRQGGSASVHRFPGSSLPMETRSDLTCGLRWLLRWLT